jgi:hypothetical protein
MSMMRKAVTSRGHRALRAGAMHVALVLAVLLCVSAVRAAAVYMTMSATKTEGGNVHVCVGVESGGQKVAGSAATIAPWLNAGGNLLAIGLDAQEANAFLPFQLTTKKAEHIAASFEPFGASSLLAGVAPADVHNRDPRDFPLVSAGATVIGNGILARAGNVVFCQLAPWQFQDNKQPNLKRTYRRTSFLLSRLLANMGVAASTPVLPRFSRPVTAAPSEHRWLEGLYLDQPEEWDDPYRFFRW